MPPQDGGARGSERGTGRGPGAVGKVQAGGAGVTHKPQAHPPQGAGWPWRPQGDRAGRQGPQGPAASRGEPRLDAHRKLATPLPAKLESLHFSEEQIEASERGVHCWEVLAPGTPGPVSKAPCSSGSLRKVAVPCVPGGQTEAQGDHWAAQLTAEAWGTLLCRHWLLRAWGPSGWKPDRRGLATG